MAAPSPIHRDPATDGDDYGCVGRSAAKANGAIARLVREAEKRLLAGEFVDAHEVVWFVRVRLERLNDKYHCGSCDTVVKENVFAGLHDAVERAGLDGMDKADIYGW